MDHDETLRLSLSWPVSTIDGKPSLTRGSLTVSRQPGGGYLLYVTSGDENFPDGDEIQFPLSEQHANLLKGALSGHVLGEIEG